MNIRPATKEDAAAFAELFGSVEEAVLGRPSTLDEQTVYSWWGTVVLETNTWLCEEDGTLVAGAFAEISEARGVAAGAVRPSAQGRGLGTRLLELVEERLTEQGAERILSFTVAGDEPASELLERHVYREVRRFWDMGIDLEEDHPAESTAAIETFREEDARAFHAANTEAFEDHWEPHPTSFESWWERQRERTNYDPSLWFLIRDGDEVAAIARNEMRETGGYVASLGVRRAWRGRGYGRALLLHSFGEFRRRGATRATLGVDASNATGATQLYESVGMRVEMEAIAWEKRLA
jgi:ribosomal protein S18 acetylase RimI-like enzyme